MERLLQIDYIKLIMNKILGLLAVILIASCQTFDKGSTLEGKWQAVDLENPQLDSLMTTQKNFLDTFGNNTTPEQNLEIYGYTNIDSARRVTESQMKAYIATQKQVLSNTVFEFQKDSIAILTFNGDSDTCIWYIDDAGKLQLKEMKKQNMPDVEMEILSLDDTQLKVRLLGQGANSTVIFKPLDK